MAKKSDTSISGLEYLLAPHKPAGSLIALSGDEAFLKRETLAALKQILCGEGDGELAWQTFSGPIVEWRDIADVVAGRSLFGGEHQVALVEDADPFVTRSRDALEEFAKNGTAGIVVIDVKSLPGNTRLAKAVAADGLHIRCQAPDRGQELTKYRRDASRWLVERSAAAHGAKLTPDAAEMLFDLLPMSLGVIDQEVARLALLADEGGDIDATLAKEHVGGWRVRTAWDMIDAVVEGRASDALSQLDRLLIAGEQPIGLLAQLGSTLRKFATAAVLIQQAEAAGRRPALPKALEQAGILRFKIGDAERQLRQIGRQRANELARWALEADLAMKGHNSSPVRARAELERLVVRLSREATPAS